MHDRLDGGDQSGHIPRQADRISRRACWHTWAKLAFSLAPELQHEHSERVWQHTLVRAWRAGVVSDSEMLRICKWASPEVWRFGMRIILGEHGPVRARQDPLPRQLRVLLKARPLDSTQIENIWYLRDMAQGGPRRPRDPSAERRWAVLLKMAPVWCERLQTAIATWNLIHGNDGAEDKDDYCRDAAHDKKALFVTGDELAGFLCVLRGFPRRLCRGFGGFDRIPGAFSGFGGGVLPLDGLLLLPAGVGIAGKLRILLLSILFQRVQIGAIRTPFCFFRIPIWLHFSVSVR